MTVNVNVTVLARLENIVFFLGSLGGLWKRKKEVCSYNVDYLKLPPL